MERSKAGGRFGRHGLAMLFEEAEAYFTFFHGRGRTRTELRTGRKAKSGNAEITRDSSYRPMGWMISARGTNPVTLGSGLLLEPARCSTAWRDNLAKRFRFALETRKGLAGTGSGSDWQSRTKPPASGGRKTGSPDCKENAI